jgi:hypothetical protein
MSLRNALVLEPLAHATIVAAFDIISLTLHYPAALLLSKHDYYVDLKTQL